MIVWTKQNGLAEVCSDDTSPEGRIDLRLVTGVEASFSGYP